MTRAGWFRVFGRSECYVCALLALSCVILTSCGEQDEAEVATTVEVRERVVGKAAYVEGALSFVELSRDGEVVDEGELTSGPAELQVPAGTYQLRFYLRPCVGNCSELDDPTGECLREVNLGRHTEYSIIVRHGLSPDAGCRVEVARAGVD